MGGKLSHAGHGGGQDEIQPQELERQRITNKIQQRRGDGCRDAQPVVHQQHQADDAALGNGGALVDVVDAEGQNGRAQHQPEQPFQREIGNNFFE